MSDENRYYGTEGTPEPAESAAENNQTDENGYAQQNETEKAYAGTMSRAIITIITISAVTMTPWMIHPKSHRTARTIRRATAQTTARELRRMIITVSSTQRP